MRTSSHHHRKPAVRVERRMCWETRSRRFPLGGAEGGSREKVSRRCRQSRRRWVLEQEGAIGVGRGGRGKGY